VLVKTEGNYSKRSVPLGGVKGGLTHYRSSNTPNQLASEEGASVGESYYCGKQTARILEKATKKTIACKKRNLSGNVGKGGGFKQ